MMARNDLTANETTPLIRGMLLPKEEAPPIPSPLFTIPKEILFLIFMLLRNNELATVSLVSKYIHHCADDNIFWKNKAINELPTRLRTEFHFEDAFDDSIPKIRKQLYRNTLIYFNQFNPKQPSLPSFPIVPAEVAGTETNVFLDTIGGFTAGVCMTAIAWLVCSCACSSMAGACVCCSAKGAEIAGVIASGTGSLTALGAGCESWEKNKKLRERRSQRQDLWNDYQNAVSRHDTLTKRATTLCRLHNKLYSPEATSFFYRRQTGSTGEQASKLQNKNR